MTRKVLLVEDTENELAKIAVALRQAGFDMTACRSSDSPAKVLQDQQPSAVVVSCCNSEQSGMAFLRALRREPAGQQLPLLGLVDSPEARKRSHAYHAGANELLSCTAQLELIVNRVTALVARGVVIPGERASGLPHHVLLVDDSVTYSYALIAELNKDCLDVIRAESATQALRYLAIHGVGVLVLDVFLPDMSGIDLCKRIRSMPMHRDTPIFMLTGRKESVLQASAVEAGADDFAVKSRNLGVVRERVRGMISSNRPSTVRGESAVLPTSHPSQSEHVEERYALPMAQVAVSAGAASASTSMAQALPTAAVAPEPTPLAARAASASGAKAAASASGGAKAAASASGAKAAASASGAKAAAGKPGPQAVPPARNASNQRLMDRLVAASGLSEILGRRALSDACSRSGVNPQSMTPADLRRALPRIETVLKLFLSTDDLGKRLAVIESLAAPDSTSKPNP